MNMLSTGVPSTLGEYRKLTAALLGEGSRAVEFLDGKISESPRGVDEEVIAQESQMIYLLLSGELEEV